MANAVFTAALLLVGLPWTVSAQVQNETQQNRSGNTTLLNPSVQETPVPQIDQTVPPNETIPGNETSPENENLPGYETADPENMGSPDPDLKAHPSILTPFDVDIHFNETFVGGDPRLVLPDWETQYTKFPPSPWALNDTYKMMGAMRFTDQLIFEWYGTALYVKGDANGWEYDVWTDEGKLVAVTDSNSDPEHLYFTDGLALGNHTTYIIFRKPGTRGVRVDSFTMTRGIRSDAPDFNDVPRITHEFIKDGVLNNATAVFNYSQLRAEDMTIMESTPTDHGQKSVSYPVLRLTNSTRGVEIDVPANTTYIEVKGMAESFSSFHIMTNRLFPGQVLLAPNEDGEGYNGPIWAQTLDDLYMVNATLLSLVLDPTRKYNIQLFPNLAHNGEYRWRYILNLHSVTFYSAIWDGKTRDPGSLSDDSQVDGTSQSSGHKSKSTAGAIAGGVIGGLVGLILLLLLAFVLGRRSKKNPGSSEGEKSEERETETEPAVSRSSAFIVQNLAGTTGERNTPDRAAEMDRALTAFPPKAREAFEASQSAQTSGGPRPLPVPMQDGDCELSGTSATGSSFLTAGDDESLTESDDNDIDILPPSYNPRWGKAARERGAYDNSAESDTSGGSARRLNA